MLVPAASLASRPVTLSCCRVTLLAPVIVTPTGLPVIVATFVVDAVRSQLLVELQPPSMLKLLSALERVSVALGERAATGGRGDCHDGASRNGRRAHACGNRQLRRRRGEPAVGVATARETNTVLVGFSSMKNVTVPGLDCVARGVCGEDRQRVRTSAPIRGSEVGDREVGAPRRCPSGSQEGLAT